MVGDIIFCLQIIKFTLKILEYVLVLTARYETGNISQSHAGTHIFTAYKPIKLMDKLYLFYV